MGQGDDADVESGLRKAIALNPRFAPSYDRLASFYAMKHENLDEAHRLNLQAVQLDPAQVAFRVNAANVLMEMGKYDEALQVLQAAASMASKPGELQTVETRIADLQRFRDSASGSGVVVVVQPEDEPAAGDEPGGNAPQKGGVVGLVTAHPTVTATGPLRSLEGIIREVNCAPPREIEFQVAGGGKTVRLYNNEFTTIALTAAAGVVMGDSVSPCSGFEGKKALVKYVDSPDKTMDGQVSSVEILK